MGTTVIRASETLGKKNDESWGSLTWLASGTVGGTKGLTLGRVVIKAGEQNPRHGHPGCEEVLYLLAGRLEHTMSGESVILEPGDSIILPAGVFHSARSIGEEDADMIVAYNSAERDFEPEGE